MILKLGLLIAFLSVTICVATSDDRPIDKPFSVENVWENSNCSYECKPEWTGKVQKYYDDVMSSFSTFPEQVFESADEVKTTFEKLLTRIVETSNSKLEILSSGATVILESFTQIKLDTHSAQGIINEFTRLLRTLMEAERKVATNLTRVIGTEFVFVVNLDLQNLEHEFKRYMKKFEKGDGNGRKIEIDYEPVMKRVQKLIDTIGNKGDVRLSERQLEDPDVQHALLLLNLVLDYIMVLVHGLSSCSEAVLLEQRREQPIVLHVIVVAVGTFITEITESIFVNTLPNAMNLREHLKTLTKCSNKLNATLANLFKYVGRITQR